MWHRRDAGLLGAVVLSCLLIAPALAQQTAERKKPSSGYAAIFDNIDLLIDNYARFVARKYNLTDEQYEFTAELIRERAYEFLDRHEDELRSLVDRLFEVRSGGEMTQQELIEWGKQVLPIYNEAKKIIVESNNEWREILTPEQQKIHDKDLKLMYQSFETTEEQLNRIVSGQMTVDEFRNPRRSRSVARRPRNGRRMNRSPSGAGAVEKPPQAAPGGEPRVIREPVRPVPPPNPAARQAEEQGAAGPAVPPPARRTGRRAVRPTRPRGLSRAAAGSGKDFESQWDKYVADFIARYKLDSAQQQKARTILKECKDQAHRYLKGKKSTIERLDKLAEQLKKSKDKDKSKRLAEIEAQKRKLREPIDRIFERQLKPRLERLPTRAQRKAAEKAEAARKAKSAASGKTGKKDKTRKP